MKKFLRSISFILVMCILSSCATVFGGRVTSYQRTKPMPGQEQRKLRVAAFIADIVLFWPGAIIDFATCAIYKPAPKADQNISPESVPTKNSGSGK